MSLALKHHLRDLIQATGPISVADFMQQALGHPELGYYRTRDPLGRQGDFITAPEISQMFGELLGLWTATVWQRFGQPASFHLIELGPGRGTLMADALRATQTVAGFHKALSIHMVETSPVLTGHQQSSLAPYDVEKAWHTSLQEVTPDGPLDGPFALLANEFLDALPVRQVIYQNGAWHERLVDWQDGPTDQELRFMVAEPALSPQPTLPPGLSPTSVSEGSLLELPYAATHVVTDIAHMLRDHDGAALFIDYGHAQSGIGDTLQAVQAHQPVPVLADPGDADITVHVDFAHVMRVAKDAGVQAYGPQSQGGFLSALGIGTRAQHLLSAAQTDEQRRSVASAYERLVSPDAMGSLFKVVAMTSPGFGVPEGMMV